MSFKTLFTAVDVRQDDAEIDRAVEICRKLDAHLMVLVVGVAPPPPASPYGVVSNDIWAGEITEGQAAAQARADEISAKLAAAGRSATVEANYVDRGTIATISARFARYADLTLITPGADGFEQLRGCVSDGALFESGRPVVLLPAGASNFPEPKRVMIAWDASVEASKAVRDAIGIMQSAEAVDVVLIDPVPTFDGHGPEPGADLAAYLARHGISTTVHCLPRQGHEVGEVLHRTAEELGADLMVMGGFGHSRLRQRIFGGTTTTMMKGTDIAVLMAH
ncbi:MAG: universal stress protein [Rhodobacteraceae bacterium]|uniref:universal stress protein n=1 Tax=Amaricoccus sp. B4 TaxID=3368557 RepID=UPI000DACA638|nr:universal stress protein [Paracoccaceae bacterium]